MCVQRNEYKQKCNQKMQQDIENIVIITIEHLEMNKVIALNNP